MEKKLRLFSKFRTVYTDCPSEYFESRNCPICSSSVHKELTKYRLGFFPLSGEARRAEYQQHMCLECQCIFLNPIFSDYGFCQLFDEHVGASYGSEKSRCEEQVRFACKAIDDFTVQSVVDVGCFTGEFLAHLSTLKLDISLAGIDVDRHAIEAASQRFGGHIQFSCHGFDDLVFPPVTNTLVTLFHVFEHLPDPKRVLDSIFTRTCSSSSLLIEIPILELHGETEDIGGFFSPQHYTHFTFGTLLKLIEKTQWKIADWEVADDYNGFRILLSKEETLDQAERYRAELCSTDGRDVFDAYTIRRHCLLDSQRKTLERIREFSKLIIWGCGFHTEQLLSFTNLEDLASDLEVLLVDGDHFKIGKSYHNCRILDPVSLADIEDFSDTGLLVSSHSSQSGITEAALTYGFPSENIITLYNKIVAY